MTDDVTDDDVELRMVLTDVEPVWRDVLVDLMMSALSQDDNLVRVVVNSAFVHIVLQLTTTSLQLVLDVSGHCIPPVNCHSHSISQSTIESVCVSGLTECITAEPLTVTIVKTTRQTRATR